MPHGARTVTSIVEADTGQDLAVEVPGRRHGLFARRPTTIHLIDRGVHEALVQVHGAGLTRRRALMGHGPTATMAEDRAISGVG
jgi:hypothetical protein